MTGHAIKFHPVDDEYQSIDSDAVDIKAFRRKTILLAVIVGLIIGLICKSILVTGRYFQGVVSIEIKDVKGARLKDAMTRNLAGLQILDKTLILPNNTTSQLTLGEMMQKGQLRFFPADDHTISISAIGDDKIFVRNLLKFVTESYISEVTDHQRRELENLNRQQQSELAKYRKLQQQYKALQEKLRKFAQSIETGKFETAIVKYTRLMGEDITLSEKYVTQLEELNKNLSHIRAELRNPTIEIAPDKLERARKANRAYMGDYNMLKLKHQAYLYYFRKEANYLTSSLAQLRTALQKLGESISKRLDMDLPSGLTDDLLELNLAAELYEGKLARFQSRWTRYYDKLSELISEPTKADFSSVTTVLSQLRQDLLKGSGQLPTKLNQLSEKLQTGKMKRKSGLSKILIRNVARSSVTPQLDRCIELWNQIVFHLNSLFPDGNVHLKTFSRVCSRLQSRLKLIDRNIKYRLEQEQLARKKRHLQRQLVQLQLEFQQNAQMLIDTYRKILQSQSQLSKLGQSWPEWEKLKLTSIKAEGSLALMERQLKQKNISLPAPEHLKSGPVLVTARNRFGIKAENEFYVSLLVSLIAAGLIAAIQFGFTLKFLRS